MQDRTPEERRRKRFIEKSSYTAAKYLRRIEELSGLPESLAPFLEVLRRIHVDFEPLPSGRPHIGTYCVTVPQELILAAGGEDVKLCSGGITAFSIGEDITPRDACPLVKAVAGMQDIGALPPYNDCALMIVPVTCDCKKKMASMLTEFSRVHVMQVPLVRQSDELMELFLDELYALIPVLEEATGNRVTMASLQNGVRTVGAAQAQMSRFLKLKRQTPALIRGAHAMAVMNALAFMPIEVWTAALDRLCGELERRRAEGFAITRKTQPRILITGSPVVFPNIKLPLLIEEMGGALVADETCMGDRFLYDPLAVSDASFDGIMRALANRAIRPCTCPTFGDSSTRIYRLKQMIKDNAVEGVVYHVLRGCLVYDFEYQLIERELTELGIPVIRVESDYSEEDIEQLRIRIEAFLELIKLRGDTK